MSVKRTTSKGVCRECAAQWDVPTTEVGAHNLVKAPGMSYFRGLPKSCPACHGIRISYLFDDPSMAPQRPGGI